MYKKLIKFISITTLLFTQFTFAEIPKELLYQQPQNVEPAQLATIQGFQATSTPLKFVQSRIYINKINNKATLDQSNDWNKKYSILPTETTIQFTSDAQHLFSSATINFVAKAGQKYQIQTNQADKNSRKEGIQFWIENLTTGETITEKLSADTLVKQPQQTYIPVIINK